MRQAKHGDTVKVHYRGQLRDGVVFDASFDREPLQFTIGGGQVIPGFEEAVVGMNPGDLKTTELPPEKACGPYREDMLAVLDKSEFAGDELHVGQTVPITQRDGPPVDVTVTKVNESEHRADAIHP